MELPLNDVRENDIPLTTSAQQITVTSDELLTLKNIGSIPMPYGTTSGCLDGSLSPGEERTFNASQYVKAASVRKQTTIVRARRGAFTSPGSVVTTSDVGVADGVAGLDGSGLVPQAQLPGDAISVAAGLRGESVPGLPTMWANSTRTLASNRGFFVRWVPAKAWDLTVVRFYVTTAAGGDDEACIALFNAATGARLATTGAVTGKLNSTGIKSVPLEYSVDPDTAYVWEFSCGTLGGSAGALAARSIQDANMVDMFGSTFATGKLAGYADAAHVAPSTLPTIAPSSLGTFPLLVPAEV